MQSTNGRQASFRHTFTAKGGDAAHMALSARLLLRHRLALWQQQGGQQAPRTDPYFPKRRPAANRVERRDPDAAGWGTFTRGESGDPVEPKKYSLATLHAMCGELKLNTALPWHDLKDDGLWLADREPLMSRGELAVMQWHPQQDLDLPALPVPFTAYQLAAFFLAGGGTFLHEQFDNGDSLTEDSLYALGINAGNACEALREAHRLLLLAHGRFGRDDEGLRKCAHWLLSGAHRELTAAEVGDSPHAAEAATRTGAEPVQRGTAQEVAILQCLRDAGHDPLSLPPNPQGRPGVKSNARKALGNKGLWVGTTVFDKAWERLSRRGDIAYQR